LVFETDSRRAGRVAELCRDEQGWDEVRVERDLTGRERVCVGRWGG
jgi:methylase of polypeptide subunit release factors